MTHKRMNNMLKLVREMHKKFKITHKQIAFSEEEKTFRVKAMQEELDEYEETSYEATSSRSDELDALVDLVVFAIGTAERQGMLDVFEEAFERVMEKNLQKELGPNEKRGSFAIDLVKPEGWTPVDLSDLVEAPEDRQLKLKL